MKQSTAANSHWLAALLSSLLLFNLLHQIGADEAFSCPNGKLTSIFLHLEQPKIKYRFRKLHFKHVRFS